MKEYVINAEGLTDDQLSHLLLTAQKNGLTVHVNEKTPCEETQNFTERYISETEPYSSVDNDSDYFSEEVSYVPRRRKTPQYTSEYCYAKSYSAEKVHYTPCPNKKIRRLRPIPKARYFYPPINIFYKISIVAFLLFLGYNIIETKVKQLKEK